MDGRVDRSVLHLQERWPCWQDEIRFASGKFGWSWGNLVYAILLFRLFSIFFCVFWLLFCLFCQSTSYSLLFGCRSAFSFWSASCSAYFWCHSIRSVSWYVCFVCRSNCSVCPHLVLRILSSFLPVLSVPHLVHVFWLPYYLFRLFQILFVRHLILHDLFCTLGCLSACYICSQSRSLCSASCSVYFGYHSVYFTFSASCFFVFYCCSACSLCSLSCFFCSAFCSANIGCHSDCSACIWF